MTYASIIQRLPDEIRFTMLELVESLEQSMRDQLAVRREDFDALRQAVHELAEAQKRTEARVGRLETALAELAEAQKRTEARVGRLETALAELAEAQKRTEARVEELAEAQRRTEARVEELAEAQKRTEDALHRFEKSHHAHLSALGARWGIKTEDTFRNAIRDILADFADLRVERFTAYDAEGFVFGHPDQVDIDVLIRNGTLILGEIKSSASKGDVYTFERKATFYERQRGVKADRKIIITPMLDPRAQEAADRLNIRVYSSAYDFGEET